MSSPEPADARLSALISHYYDAALDSSLWPGTAKRTAQALDSTSTVIKLHGGGAQVDLLECTDNLVVAERDRAWAEDWHRRDLWVERSVAHGLSRVITDEDLVTPEEQARSGFYQEWLRHLDIHHMLGAVFQAADGVIGVLGIHRTREAGAYSEVERSKVALLLPHLQRALRLGRRLSALSQAHAAALQALDRVDTGVIVVDERCRVMLSSAMADALLRGNTELAVHGGCLVLQQPALRDALSAQVRAAVNVAQGEPADAGAALCVPRAGRLPLVLEIAPLRPTATRGRRRWCSSATRKRRPIWTDCAPCSTSRGPKPQSPPRWHRGVRWKASRPGWASAWRPSVPTSSASWPRPARTARPKSSPCSPAAPD